MTETLNSIVPGAGFVSILNGILIAVIGAAVLMLAVKFRKRR